MKVVMSMAISVDGFIADTNGSEDFLSNNNWLLFKKFLKKYKHVIWGRKTFEAVSQWEQEYLNNLPGVEIIVVTTDRGYKSKFDFVKVCYGIESALEYCRKTYGVAYISGGQHLNTEFIKRNLITDIFLQIQPILIGSGLQLFSEDIKDTKLKFISMQEFKKINILHYKTILN